MVGFTIYLDWAVVEKLQKIGEKSGGLSLEQTIESILTVPLALLVETVSVPASPLLKEEKKIREARRSDHRNRDLGQILLDGALIRPEDLATAQEIVKNNPGTKLAKVLLENKFVTQETLSTVFSFQLGVPTVDLNQYKVKPEAVALIPENVAREHNVIPLMVEGDTLLVCMSDPTDLQVIDSLAVISRKNIRPAVPLRGNIEEAIGRDYGQKGY